MPVLDIRDATQPRSRLNVATTSGGGNGDPSPGPEPIPASDEESDLAELEPAPPAKAPGKKKPSDTISLSLDWAGELKFKNSSGSPAIELHSGSPGVTSPPQALGYAIMACMAMDVVHVLERARNDLRTMSVKFIGKRSSEHPRRFISVTLHFDLTGRIDAHVVDRAIELSRVKYCSVWNSLNPDIAFTATHRIHE